MLFFIIGIIIVFGIYKFSQDNISNDSTSSQDEKDIQEIQQELEKIGIEIDPDELEKVE